MAKRKPIHLAPVAATQSDIHHGLARIIELATKWQSILQWTQTLKAAKDFRRYRCEVFVLSGQIEDHRSRNGELQAIMKGGSLSEAEHNQAEKQLAEVQIWLVTNYQEMFDDVQRYGALSEERYKQVTGAQQELIELMNLVRQHTPQLLECVPDVDFGICSKNEVDIFRDPPEVDHSPLRRDLRKLEGQAPVLLPEKPPGQPEAPIKGISLLDAALLANEDDPDVAKVTKSRWHYNRDPKLPTPIGVAQKHIQREIYDPQELLAFIAIVDPDSVQRVRDGYSEYLQMVRKTV